MSSIRRDMLRETPGGAPQYTAYLNGAAYELIPAPGDVVVNTGATAYRSRVDHGDFIRFEKLNSHQWQAFTRGGLSYVFTDGFPLGAQIAGEYYLQRIMDRFFNFAIYSYDIVYFPSSSTNAVDLVLKSIEYGANFGAGTPSRARVDLSWGPTAQCGTVSQLAGLSLPDGAAMDYRTGMRRIRGIQQLNTVTTNVRANASAPWSSVRSWQLNYHSVDCTAPVSPRRQLDSIDMTGLPGSPSALAGPRLSFTYGPPANSTPTTRVSTAGAIKEDYSGAPIGAIYSTLMDLDGDKLPD